MMTQDTGPGLPLAGSSQSTRAPSADSLGDRPPGEPISADAYFDVVAEVSRFFAHQLGNLLTGLNLTLDTLACIKRTDPRMETLLPRALSMMERLCAFKESWSGLGDKTAHRFDMCEPVPLVEGVLHDARLGSEFIVDVTGDRDTPALYCHPGLLATALQYLVRNAVDAMPEGGHVGVDVRPDGDFIVITVRDSGPGIPPDIQSKIFYEPVSTKPYGGGIGLMLVAMIAKRVHRGDVKWSTRAPQGCSIELRLPGSDKHVARIVP